jgi:hypothetical protein
MTLLSRSGKKPTSARLQTLEGRSKDRPMEISSASAIISDLYLSSRGGRVSLLAKSRPIRTNPIERTLRITRL